MLLNAAKFQGYSFYRFWVIKGKPTGVGGVKLPPPPPQPRLGLSQNARLFSSCVMHMEWFESL